MLNGLVRNTAIPAYLTENGSDPFPRLRRISARRTR